jgi:S-DNA-T family DNA segregation ATPase FtsK/SpoIIIE
MNPETLAHTWGGQVLTFCRRQGIRASVESAIRSSQVLAFCLRLGDPGDLSKLLALDETLALALSADSVRLGRLRGWVTCEAALPAAMFRPLALDALAPGRGPAVALGKSVVGAPVGLDLADSLTPHVLVAGTTGSGKTALLSAILAQLARQCDPAELRLLVIDAKGDLRPFAHLPHLAHPIIHDPREAIQVLAWAVAELDRRKSSPVPWRLVIVIDEIAELLAVAGGKDGAAAESLRRIAALGRSLGVHLICGTQHPTGDVLGGSLAKANLPARLTGRVLDAQASTLATGQAGLAAHRLRGRGDFLAVAGGEVQRLQVAFVGERDLATLPRTGQANVPRLDLDAATVDGALAIPAPPAGGGPDPLEAGALAWVLAHSVGGVPGIGTIKSGLAVGSAKAGRLQRFARELLTELDAHGCEVLCSCEDAGAEPGEESEAGNG